MVAASLTDFRAAVASLLIGIASLLPGRISWHMLRPRLIAVNGFLLCMWLVVPFTMSLDQLGRFSTSGARLCLLITIKANAIVTFFTAFLAPMSPCALGAALRALHCPARMVWLFLLLDRNVYILRQEWTNIFAAAKLRGMVLRASLHAYRSMAALLALWLCRAWDKARLLQDALLLRGYDGEARFAVSGHYLSGLMFWPLLLPALFLLLYLNFFLP